MAKITIIPTSHIARESIQNIRETAEREKPDCIAVELDMGRYHALKEGEGSIWKEDADASSFSFSALRSLGIITFVFYFVLKNLQQSLGRVVGVAPGSEMLEAVKVGKERGIPVIFIDRDIGETFLKIKQVPAKEKLKLLTFLFRAMFGGAGLSKNSEKIDLTKVPPEQLVDTAIELLRKEFPKLHSILIEERNQYMAQRIIELSKRFQNIEAVVGAGHAKGILEIIKAN